MISIQVDPYHRISQPNIQRIVLNKINMIIEHVALE